MAIAKCRECGTEVSDSAKVCPKCGLSKPVKKTSFLVKIIAIIFGLSMLGTIIGGISGGSSTSVSNASSALTSAPSLSSKEKALSAVKLEKWDWKKGGFDSVMMLTAKIKNDSDRDVKDIEIECTHTSNSGTRIDSNKKVAFELIKAGKTITIKNFSMGFIHSQATSTSCRITNLVVI